MALLSMGYILASLLFSATGWRVAGFVVGLCTFGTSFLAFLGAAGISNQLKHGLRQNIPAVLFGCVMIFAAWYLSDNFSIRIFDHVFSGVEWGVAGLILGVVAGLTTY